MFDAQTERAIEDERERMAELLRFIRLLGASVWVLSVLLASDNRKELHDFGLQPIMYFGVAVLLLVLGRSRRLNVWSAWAVPFIDVPTVLLIEYSRVASSQQPLAN